MSAAVLFRPASTRAPLSFVAGLLLLLLSRRLLISCCDGWTMSDAFVRAVLRRRRRQLQSRASGSGRAPGARNVFFIWATPRHSEIWISVATNSDFHHQI